MKKIKFLRGFRGVLTNEQHYTPLTVVELDDGIADALVAKGVAEFCVEKVTPKKKPVARKKKPTGKISTKRVNK